MFYVPLVLKIVLTVVAGYFIFMSLGWVSSQPTVKGALLSVFVFLLMAVFLIMLHGGHVI